MLRNSTIWHHVHYNRTQRKNLLLGRRARPSTPTVCPLLLGTPVVLVLILPNYPRGRDNLKYFGIYDDSEVVGKVRGARFHYAVILALACSVISATAEAQDFKIVPIRPGTSRSEPLITAAQLQLGESGRPISIGMLKFKHDVPLHRASTYLRESEG